MCVCDSALAAYALIATPFSLFFFLSRKTAVAGGGRKRLAAGRAPSRIRSHLRCSIWLWPLLTSIQHPLPHASPPGLKSKIHRRASPKLSIMRSWCRKTRWEGSVPGRTAEQFTGVSPSARWCRGENRMDLRSISWPGRPGLSSLQGGVWDWRAGGADYDTFQFRELNKQLHSEKQHMPPEKQTKKTPVYYVKHSLL